MFAGASSRLRTQAGAVYSAMPRALSYLLKLSLNPATEKHQLVAAVENDPAILDEFLALGVPEQLASWHEPLNPVHFQVTAARLAMRQVQHPPSQEQWQTSLSHWQGALFQQYLAENIAQALNYADPREARLTGLLASTIENPASRLPELPRDAIRFQFAPLDALKNTHQLIRIIATTTQLQQSPNLPVREDYLEAWDLPDINLSAEISKAREKVSLLINSIVTPYDSPIDQYESDLGDLKSAVQHYLYKVIFDQQLAATKSLTTDVNQLGSALFDLKNCAIFEVTEDGLRHEAISVTSEKSIITKAAQKRSITTSIDTSLIVIDQQMLERSGSDALIAAPLINKDPLTNKDKVIGVLVAGISRSSLAEQLQELEIFTISIAAALSRSATPDMISIKEIQRRTREINHEVNNPFTIAQNYLKILALKLGEEHEASDSIAIISNEIQRAAKLIKQYSHMGEANQADSARTNCNELLEELTKVFKGSYSNITFTTHLDASEPHTSLPSDQFKQIIINLLKNAAEAMNFAGKISIRSTANIRFPDADYVELEIVDTGPGILHELKENLFTAGTTSKSDTNAGLGLSIVKDIINSATGNISFRTGESGTTFKLLLPQIITQKDSAKIEDSL